MACYQWFAGFGKSQKKQKCKGLNPSKPNRCRDFGI